MISHLNTNSIRNKSDNLKDLIGESIDICLISETKIDDTFAVGQFEINGFHPPFREDRNDKGGGLLLYVRNHIPCKMLPINCQNKIETIVVEINLKKKKWVMIGSSNPHKSMISSHLGGVGKLLNDLHEKYDNFILIVDLNSEVCEEEMQIFCTT